MDARPSTVQTLRDVRAGTAGARERLVDEVYGELRRIAARHLQHERPGHTLQATALVHEAWLRLMGSANVDPADRAQFLAAASESIRRILIDHARRRQADKRGGGERPVTLTDAATDLPLDPAELLALHEALEELARLKQRHARVVELRFFGGLDLTQVGEVLGISPHTAREDWRTARAWLYRRLRTGEKGTSPGPSDCA